MRGTLVAVLLVLSLAPSLSAQPASAHPFIEETVPGSAANGPVGTTEVVVFFTEPVDINFSEIRIFDSNGDQIDNRDTAHYDGESSLVVTTPPLEEGAYTASTKVLSKVDGHLVPNAFLFGVGAAVVTPHPDGGEPIDETPFLPGAAAKFPGLVGQTVVLGAVIASLAIWGTQNKRFIRDVKEAGLERMQLFYRGRFMQITGIGLVLVFVSDVLIIAVQSLRLEAPPAEVIQTHFGTIWLARVVLTVALLGIWFGMDRRKSPLGTRNQIPMLAVSLALILTTSMVGHGAATEQPGALALDYIHNLVAAVWIGGIIYFAFVLHPSLSQLREPYRERMSLVLIPRFSIAFIISVGVVIVTGPTLLWFLDDDVGLIVGSVFGQLIMLKIAIAAVMVGLGGFNQFKVQRAGEEELSAGRGGRGEAKAQVHKRLKTALRADVALGIALLGVVALLTNGTPPVEDPRGAAAQGMGMTMPVYGLSTTEFTENAMFGVEILPFSKGANTILVWVTDAQGNPLGDSDQVKVKVSNPSRNISPIEVQMRPVTLEGEDGPSEFAGEVTFGFFGEWLVEIEAQRTENANESKMLNLFVKPRLADIQARVVEYELPGDGKPLYPVYDGAGSIWISDASAPRIWQFELDAERFTEHAFEGEGTTFLSHDGNNGRIWFTDTPGNQIGFIDTGTKQITTVDIPALEPTTSDNTPLFIQAGLDGSAWVTVTNKDAILRYLPESGAFERIALPEGGSLPFALTADAGGIIWYTATGTGKIGYIDPDTNGITEIPTGAAALQAPEALLFDEDGNLWVAEHSGQAITRFGTVLGTFERIPVPDGDSLPFGMAQDRYDNIWFAQHAIDKIGVYDPDNGDLVEVEIPTASSSVQFMTADGDGNVWLVEQQANKIGMVEITEVPPSTPPAGPAPGQQGAGGPVGGLESIYSGLRYSELISPMVALGIVSMSLFYAKGIYDKRRLNALVGSG